MVTTVNLHVWRREIPSGLKEQKAVVESLLDNVSKWHEKNKTGERNHAVEGLMKLLGGHDVTRPVVINILDEPLDPDKAVLQAIFED